MCDLLETLNQKFKTNGENPGYFGNLTATFLLAGRRVKIQKPLSCLLVLYNFTCYTKSSRSKVKVTFCEPETF